MSAVRPCAIVGIGATEFSKDSGRSELRLAIEAVTAALADAGLAAHEVDGLVAFAMDNNNENAVARNLGLSALRFFARTPYGGGGGCATVELATLAITGGKADVVVCYRAMNERSQSRFGQPTTTSSTGGLQRSLSPSGLIDMSWALPYGLSTPASHMALSAQRYLHEYNVTSETFGRIAINQRNYAQTNPHAYFSDRPLTLDDYHASRMIADPLRLLDCCQETDGAVAIVVTSLERARDLKQKPVKVLGSAQGMGPRQNGMASVYHSNIAQATDTAVAAQQLWAETGLSPADIDVANIYDHFSCAVALQLEALGFCGPGEAPDLIADGGLAIDGQIPTNTNGGQLSEAYMHGFNGIAELVRQMRGTAINQVPGAKHGLATSGSHVPTSGLILGADD
jgi:acetyl-CoA acetyltransferase